MGAKLKLFFKISSFMAFGALALILGGLFLTGCGHEHTFSAWQVETPASCTEKGEEKRVCEECGKVETRKIDALGHKYDSWQILEPASCTETGLQKHVCTVCKHEEEQIIQAKGHTITVEKGYDATCEEPGETDMEYCSVCETIFKQHTQIAPLGHRMSEWTSLKDENSNDCNGLHEQHCLNGCGLRQEEVCVYDTVETEPTCQQAGHHEHECPKCHDHVSHDYAPKLEHVWSSKFEMTGWKNGNPIHTQRCLNLGCEELKESDCVFDEEHMTEKEATCTDKATKTYSCTSCGQTKTEIGDDELGHSWLDKWEPCETPKGHHQHKCERCGATEIQLCNLSIAYEKADCENSAKEIYTCSICDRRTVHETSAALGHSWSTEYKHKSGESEEDSYHIRTCTRCQKEEEPEKCVFTLDKQEDATCSSNEVITRHCERCQFSYEESGQSALGHDYGDGSWTFFGEHDGKICHVQTCQREGCGHQNFEECAYTLEVTKNPDCTNKGQKSGACERCQHQFEEEIAELGHLWAQNEEDKKDWIITDKDHTRTCKRAGCGVTETAEHSFEESNICGCGYDGLEYVVRNGYAAVLRGTRVKNAKKIVIASTYKGLDVEEISSGYDTFEGFLCGFHSFTKVQEVVLPKTLKYIRSAAFMGCTSLENVWVDMGEDESSALIEIEKSAFENCSRLLTAKLPEGLKTIGASAFQSCKALNVITIPESVVSIGSNAFKGTQFIDNKANWTGDALYINKHLIKADASLSGEYVVETGTICISGGAFNDCLGLISVVLPAELVEVGSDAFKNCTLLAKVTFKGSFQDWLKIDFENDYASPMCHASTLTIEGAHDDIDIPENVTYIPAGAFKGTQIKSVHIPKSVTKIGEEAFDGCAELETVTWDDECNLEYVGLNAFRGTKFYETEMAKGAMYVGHCLVETNEKLGVDENGKYDVLEGTYSIAPGAFENNQTIKFVVLPASLQFIGEKAFTNSALEMAEFKNAAGWYAFMLQGAGRSPSADILGAGGTEEPEKNSNRQKAAQLLKFTYQSYWRKNLKL